MKYGLFIFDFDGTLADTFPWFSGVINQVAEKYHFKKVSEEDSLRLRSWNVKDIMTFLEIPMWKTPLISAEFRKLMNHDIHAIELFGGVKELITKLKEKNTETALVSSNSKENVRHILKRYRIREIDYFKCGVSVKGKSSKLRSVIRRSGRQLSDVIYIGDEIRDIHAARKVGIDSGVVSWGYNDVEALIAEKPDRIYYDMNEIYERNI